MNVTNNKITIRYATEKDLPRVAELSTEVLLIHSRAHEDLFNEGFAKKLLEIYQKTLCEVKDSFIVVAEVEGKVVGYELLTMKTREDFWAEQFRRVLVVDEVCVDEKYRRRGVARELENFAESLARQNGIISLMATVYDFNTASKKLHESLGYQKLSIKYHKALGEAK
jgi:ribosomal protein S18 acetylase RimI-like enzyme